VTFLLFAWLLTQGRQPAPAKSDAQVGAWLTPEEAGKYSFREDDLEFRQPPATTRGFQAIGPEIELKTPSDLSVVEPPVIVEVLFKAEGAAINPASFKIKVRYLRAWIDITEKVRTLIRMTERAVLNADRLYVPNALAQPGSFRFQIAISDTAGRETQQEFRVTIRKRAG
jgi:hypothetical protein